MKYPNQYSFGTEREEVRVGDLVWWNEGVCVGFIVEVMEWPEEYARWGLDQPSIALSNLHPFHANRVKHMQHIGGVTTGGTVVNSADQMEEEGVGRLSDHERAELEWAISEAKGRVAPEHRDAPFCVSAIKDMIRDEEDWHVHFVDEECRVVGTVVVPFRPNTRN